MFNLPRILAPLLWALGAFSAQTALATPANWPEFIWAAQHTTAAPAAGLDALRIQQLIKQGK
ncbi:MAG TPA: hypothetical protein PK129_14405, partial [Cellvibrionaceae bacterium]|nr:hypothetical protein [Cellvibrionaceae bacterium]